MANPPAKIQVQPRNPIGFVLWFACQQFADFLLKFERQHLVGIQQQNPVTGAKIQGDVLLFCVAAERVITGFSPKRLRNLDAAIA